MIHIFLGFLNVIPREGTTEESRPVTDMKFTPRGEVIDLTSNMLPLDAKDAKLAISRARSRQLRELLKALAKRRSEGAL